jgi:hypothetical protein
MTLFPLLLLATGNGACWRGVEQTTLFLMALGGTWFLYLTRVRHAPVPAPSSKNPPKKKAEPPSFR